MGLELAYKISSNGLLWLVRYSVINFKINGIKIANQDFQLLESATPILQSHPQYNMCYSRLAPATEFHRNMYGLYGLQNGKI